VRIKGYKVRGESYIYKKLLIYALHHLKGVPIGDLVKEFKLQKQSIVKILKRAENNPFELKDEIEELKLSKDKE
jgi:hypothetical protein